MARFFLSFIFIVGTINGMQTNSTTFLRPIDWSSMPQDYLSNDEDQINALNKIRKELKYLESSLITIFDYDPKNEDELIKFRIYIAKKLHNITQFITYLKTKKTLNRYTIPGDPEIIKQQIKTCIELYKAEEDSLSIKANIIQKTIETPETNENSLPIRTYQKRTIARDQNLYTVKRHKKNF